VLRKGFVKMLTRRKYGNMWIMRIALAIDYTDHCETPKPLVI